MLTRCRFPQRFVRPTPGGTRRCVGWGAAVALLLTPGLASAQAMTKAQRAEAQTKLDSFLFNKMLVARVTFPAYKDGINLKTDGSWDSRSVTRAIKDHGVGLEPGDRASVTAVKLGDNRLEIHLNGGGAGTLMDSLMTSDAKKNAREASGGKLPGGSRINLQFGRIITPEELADLNTLAAYLEPLVDTAALKQAAMRQAIPEKFKEAAAQGLVVLGMDKATVFAIMGEPKSKNVDTSGDVPIEKWVFELKDLKTRVVTFKAGEVVKIDEF